MILVRDLVSKSKKAHDFWSNSQLVKFIFDLQLDEELKISLSTVYKTLSNLEDLALAEVDQYIISPEGKKIKQYRSRIGKVEITVDDLEPSLNLYPNTDNPKSNR